MERVEIFISYNVKIVAFYFQSLLLKYVQGIARLIWDKF